MWLILLGGTSIKEYRVLSNRQQILTKNSEGEVVLWHVLHVSVGEGQCGGGAV